MGQFKGKIALITGGSSGIGRATALAFAKQGTKVVIADMNIEGGNETVQMIKEAQGEAIFVKADISKTDEVETMINKVVRTYGGLDYAHNNAGVGTGSPAPTADFTEEYWDRIISINLKGVWLCMKYEIPQMLKRGGGAIVNTSSSAGLVGYAGRVWLAGRRKYHLRVFDYFADRPDDLLLLDICGGEGWEILLPFLARARALGAFPMENVFPIPPAANEVTPPDQEEAEIAAESAWSAAEALDLVPLAD